MGLEALSGTENRWLHEIKAIFPWTKEYRTMQAMLEAKKKGEEESLLVSQGGW